MENKLRKHMKEKFILVSGENFEVYVGLAEKDGRWFYAYAVQLGPKETLGSGLYTLPFNEDCPCISRDAALEAVKVAVLNRLDEIQKELLLLPAAERQAPETALGKCKDSIPVSRQRSFF